jgi:hypothetical protein
MVVLFSVEILMTPHNFLEILLYPFVDVSHEGNLEQSIVNFLAFDGGINLQLNDFRSLTPPST